mmetsp:Transcript_15709/g.26830  ORF Transcript_15709/g.26830 Transcript_15709/m.26830 type:complete len:115 (+) Transcript_15709:260-604(+)
MTVPPSSSSDQNTKNASLLRDKKKKKKKDRELLLLLISGLLITSCHPCLSVELASRLGLPSVDLLRIAILNIIFIVLALALFVGKEDNYDGSGEKILHGGGNEEREVATTKKNA